MDNVRIKKRQWRPKPPVDQQPQVRKKIRLIRLEDPNKKVVMKNDSCQRQVIDNHCQEPKPVTSSVQDKFQGSKPKCQEAETNKQSCKFQQYPDKTQTKADVSQLAGFLRKRSFADGTSMRTTVHTSDVIKKSSHTCDDKPANNKSMNSTCSPVKKVVMKNDSCQRQVIDNHCQEPKPVTSSVQDRFQGSKPKCQEAETNKQSCKFQQYPDKTQTKADVSQLAGFLRKRSFADGTSMRTTVHTSDVIKKTSHTCDDTPVNNKSTSSTFSPVKDNPSVQDSVRCDIKHRTVLGQATKPPCLKANKNPVAAIESDDDFDYSLDLMGDYTLKVSDHYKEPTPFWFEAGQTTCGTSVPVKPANLDTVCKTDQRPSLNNSLDTTYSHPQKFIPKIDLDITLDTTQDHEEFDSIMNSRRGYIYINYSRHRGVKRRIAYDDDEEVPIPCKRPRTC